MAELHAFDPASSLDNQEAIAVFMADAFETGDAAYIAKALGVVVKLPGIADIARETGLSPKQIHRSFSGTGSPTLRTTLAVMGAIGVTVTTKLHRRISPKKTRLRPGGSGKTA